MLVFILMVSDLSQRVLDCYLLNSWAHFVIFIFYTDIQSDIINSPDNDSADRPTNLVHLVTVSQPVVVTILSPELRQRSFFLRGELYKVNLYN